MALNDLMMKDFIRATRAGQKEELREILATNKSLASHHEFLWNGTALHQAILGENLEMCRLLLDGGADIESVDERQRTPFLWAAMHGNVAILQLLKSAQCNVDARDRYELTALHLASSNGHIDAVRFLLDHGVNIDICDKYGQTALHIASEWGHSNVCAVLIQQGASVDIRDENGQTALHIASRWGQSNVCTVLIQQGASVDIRDKNGSTALHLACGDPSIFRTSDHLSAVKLLMSAGADVRAVNNDGKNPQQIAEERSAVSGKGGKVAASIVSFLRSLGDKDDSSQSIEHQDTGIPTNPVAEIKQPKRSYESDEEFVEQGKETHGQGKQPNPQTEEKMEREHKDDDNVAKDPRVWYQDYMASTDWQTDATSGYHTGSDVHAVESLSGILPFFEPRDKASEIPVLPSSSSKPVKKPVVALPSVALSSVPPETAPFLDVEMTWRKWESVSDTIGSSGGVIRSRQCDIQLIIPRDAVSYPTPFTVSLHAVCGKPPKQGGTTAGSEIIELEPHNTRFGKPVQLRAGHSRVFTPNSLYSLALLYSSDGSDWKEVAVLTHVDQKVEYEDNVITVDESHICIEARHFCCWWCNVFQSSININMILFVPEEERSSWNLQIYLMDVRYASDVLDKIRRKEHGRRFVCLENAPSFHCLGNQVVQIKTDSTAIPKGWALPQQYQQIDICYDALFAVLCNAPFHAERTISLVREDTADAIPSADIELQLIIRVAASDRDAKAVDIPVPVGAWRRQQDSWRPVENIAGARTSSDDVRRSPLQGCGNGGDSEQPRLAEIAFRHQRSTTEGRGGKSQQDHTFTDAYPTGDDGVPSNGVEQELMFSTYSTTIATKVRSLAARLGGFWERWTDLPVDVLHQVCGLTADRSEELADRLHVSSMDMLTKPKVDVPVKIVRQILSIWIQRESNKATLDVLFGVLERMELLRKLEATLRELVGAEMDRI